MARNWIFIGNSLKNLLWNLRPDSEIISHRCSLGDPSQNVREIWSVKKHDSGEWGLLALCGHEEIFKTSSVKRLVSF